MAWEAILALHLSFTPPPVSQGGQDTIHLTLASSRTTTLPHTSRSGGQGISRGWALGSWLDQHIPLCFITLTWKWGTFQCSKRIVRLWHMGAHTVAIAGTPIKRNHWTPWSRPCDIPRDLGGGRLLKPCHMTHCCGHWGLCLGGSTLSQNSCSH